MTKHKINSGTQRPININKDLVKIDQLSVPLCIEVNTNEIKTLNPSAKFSLDNIDYKHKITWVAEYNSGHTIYEQQGNRVISSESIDHKKIRKFSLYYDDKLISSLNIGVGQYFFYRKRTVLATGKNVVDVIHIYGWRSAIDRSHLNYSECVCFLYESDKRVEIGQFVLESKGDAKNNWKYEPRWRDIDNIITE